MDGVARAPDEPPTAGKILRVLGSAPSADVLGVCRGSAEV
jgi:hypothetical protein